MEKISIIIPAYNEERRIKTEIYEAVDELREIRDNPRTTIEGKNLILFLLFAALLRGDKVLVLCYNEEVYHFYNNLF